VADNSQQQGNGGTAAAAGAAGAAATGGGDGGATVKPGDVALPKLPLPDNQRVKLAKAQVADLIAQAIERAGQRELATLHIPDTARWNVSRPDIQQLALKLTDEAFGKIITTARDRLREGLADELGKTQRPHDVADGLRERFGGMATRDARRVVRTLFRDLYNQASLDVYRAIGVQEVRASDGHGGLTGRTDPECLKRNGQVFSVDEALKLKAYHPTVHPRCTLSFIPVIPEGGLGGSLDLPPVEDLAADLPENTDLHLAWDPDLHPKWPMGTPGDDASGHHLAGEFMQFSDLFSFFSHQVNPDAPHDISWIAHGATHIKSVTVQKAPVSGAGPTISQEPATITTVKKGTHLYNPDGSYAGMIAKKSTGYYAKVVLTPPPGAGGPKYVYQHNLDAYRVGDGPPLSLDTGAVFSIVLAPQGIKAPAHVQVHVENSTKIDTAAFMKFLQNLDEGNDLTEAKSTLDAANLSATGSKYQPYAKPTVQKKTNYTAFTKHIGGGKQPGKMWKVSTLKVNDQFLIPEDWFGGQDGYQGQLAKVTKKWTKSNGYVHFQVMTGPSAGETKLVYLGYYGSDKQVVLSEVAKPPPPPLKVGQTGTAEQMKSLGAKIVLPKGTVIPGQSPTPHDLTATVTKKQPLGGVIVNITGGGVGVELPAETKITYLEAPPKGGTDILQPGILDQFTIDGGKVHIPVADNVVDSSTHDPSIPMPENGQVTPEMWKRFGKVDQERYVYLQQKYGVWADGQGKTKLAQVKSAFHHSVVQKVEHAFNAQYGSTGTGHKIVGPESGNTGGGAGEMTLKAANAMSLADWQQTQASVDPDGKYGSWAEAMNVVMLAMEEVAQWDMYNRVGEPDVLAFHAGSGSTKKDVIDQGKAITGGYSWSYYPGVWSEGTTDAITMPIRFLTMNYYVPPSQGHLSSEHEISSRYFIQVADHSKWYHGTTGSFSQAGSLFGHKPKGGSIWAQVGQKAGVIKLSPKEEYDQLPAVKAKTMLPGATFKIQTGKSGKPGDFATATVAQVYSDGSFTDDAGRYFPANADVKQISAGSAVVDVGKLQSVGVDNPALAMGAKVYDDDGKVVGYVSTAGGSFVNVKYLNPDGSVNQESKVTLNTPATIKTVLPVQAQQLQPGDQFYIPGSKGKKIGTVTNVNGGFVYYVAEGTSSQQTLAADTHPTYPLPKPDSAFGPLPDPPADAKPFVAAKAEPAPKVAPKPAPAPAPKAVGETLKDKDIFALQPGDQFTIQQIGNPKYVGATGEVTSNSGGIMMVKWIDLPNHDDPAGPLAKGWTIHTDGMLNGVVVEKAAPSFTHFDSAPVTAVGQTVKKKIKDMQVGEAMYGTPDSGSQLIGWVTEKKDGGAVLQLVKPGTKDPYPDMKPLAMTGGAQPEAEVDVIDPASAMKSVAPPPSAAPTTQGFWKDLKQGDTFEVAPGGGWNQQFVGGIGVVDKVENGEVYYHYTALPGHTSASGILGSPQTKPLANPGLPVNITPAGVPAPQVPTGEHTKPPLVKTKAGTLKVGEHLWIYKTETYVGEVIHKDPDGSVTVEMTNGQTKVYGPKTSVKKSTVAPGLPPVGGEPPETWVEGAPGTMMGGPHVTPQVGDTAYLQGKPYYKLTEKHADGSWSHVFLTDSTEGVSKGDVHTVGDGTIEEMWQNPNLKLWRAPGEPAPAQVSADGLPVANGQAVADYILDNKGAPASKHTPGVKTVKVGDAKPGDVVYPSYEAPAQSPSGILIVNPDGDANYPLAFAASTGGGEPFPLHKDTEINVWSPTATGEGVPPVGTKVTMESLPVGTWVELHGKTWQVTDTSTNLVMLTDADGEMKAFKKTDTAWIASAPAAPAPIPAKIGEPVPAGSPPEPPPPMSKLEAQSILDSAPHHEGLLTKQMKDLTVGDVIYTGSGDPMGVVTAKTVTGGGTMTAVGGGEVKMSPNDYAAVIPPAGSPSAILPDIPEKINPGGYKSKKASSFKPGEPVYNYHSGKLIGQVQGTEDGKIVVVLPSGDTKSYKPTTTWKYLPTYAGEGKQPPLPGEESAAAAAEPHPTTTSSSITTTAAFDVLDNAPHTTAGKLAKMSDLVPGDLIYDSTGNATGVVMEKSVTGGGKVITPEGEVFPHPPDALMHVAIGHGAPEAAGASSPVAPAGLPEPEHTGSALQGFGLSQTTYAIHDFKPGTYFKGTGYPWYGMVQKNDGADGQVVVKWITGDYAGQSVPADFSNWDTKARIVHVNEPPVTPAAETPPVLTYKNADLKVGDHFQLGVIPGQNSWANGATFKVIEPESSTGGVGVEVVNAPNGPHMVGETTLMPGIGPYTETPIEIVPTPKPPVVHTPLAGATPYHADSIPTTSKSKKASSFQVGDAAYNYHTGKLIGTVSSKPGDGTITLKKPDGSEKTYKTSTTWKYPADAAAGSAPTPAAAPASDIPEPSGDYVSLAKIPAGTHIFVSGNHLGTVVSATPGTASKKATITVTSPSGKTHTFDGPSWPSVQVPAGTDLSGGDGPTNPAALTGAPAAAAPEAPQAAQAPIVNWDAQNITFTPQKAAGGTQGAQWAQGSDGGKYVVKTYAGDPPAKAKNRVATEVLANAVYKLMGVPVPDGGKATVNGKPAYVSRALPSDAESQKFGSTWKTVHADAATALGQGFMTDALLANHDVVGLDDDNILWAGGKGYRVDVGGTLFFRAQGGVKQGYDGTPSEVWSMLQKKGGQADRSMIVTDVMKKAQAAAIAGALTPAIIEALVDAAGFADPEYAALVKKTLNARVSWMGKYAAGQVKEDVQAAFDPAKHPRLPKGHAGGEFAKVLSAVEGAVEGAGGSAGKLGKPKQSGPLQKVGVVVTPKAGKSKTLLDQALADIDKVHGTTSTLGVSKTDPKKRKTTPFAVAHIKGNTRGVLRYKPGIGPSSVTVSSSEKPDQQVATALHELGHLLDMHLAAGYGVRGGYLTSGLNKDKSPAMSHLLDVLWESDAIKDLRALNDGPKKAKIPSGKPGAMMSASVPSKFVKYLLHRNEQFARAYAQYIAERSGDAALKAKLQNHLKKKGKVAFFMPRQWEDADFAPIADAFDALFKEQGWLKT
jgi:SPP1 gp7 family putative phage head morphogenesis protein